MLGIGYPNLVAESTTISGGSWSTACPRANMLSRRMYEVARTVDTLTTSTRWTIDWGSATDVRGLALIGHNLSSAATIRRKLGTTSGGAEVSDTGALPAWAFTPRQYSGRAHNVIVLSPAGAARYDTVEINDTTNPDGYIEIAHLFVGPIWTPTYDVSYGLQDGFVTTDGVTRGPTGALHASQMLPLRQTTCVLEASPLAEADELHEILRTAGRTELLLYVRDQSDRAATQRYGGVCTFEELSAVDYPYYRMRRVPLKFTQFA